jgi:uridylate kinase
MKTPAYKRVLIKVSGEALAGGNSTGLDFAFIDEVCKAVKQCVDMGAQVAIVVGGGNFWRGLKNGEGHMERSKADHMGMLATVMNALAVSDRMEQQGMSVKVMTSVAMTTFADVYTRRDAVAALENGTVVIFGGGTGNPFFSTDTAAALRACEIGADAILLAKNVDGVYTADPRTDPTAVKYDSVPYAEVLEKHLNVMDMTATSLAMDNKIPAVVFPLADPENIVRAVLGENVGTTVTL